MGFKLKSGNTTTFKMMGSSPMQMDEGKKHVPTEQEIAEQSAREAKAENTYEQGATTNPESVEVAEDAKTKTPELHGKYKESRVKELLAGGLDGLTDAQIAKLSRTGQLNNTGQSSISKARNVELNDTLEARKRGAEGSGGTPLSNFSAQYFADLGVDNPTDAQKRVMERKFQQSK